MNVQGEAKQQRAARRSPERLEVHTVVQRLAAINNGQSVRKKAWNSQAMVECRCAYCTGANTRPANATRTTK